ncbi:MAG: DUF2769 domain-containing protein [Nanoarchaeota archaeon]|nr:DUF2769 domain-containing protein [Nanoarchaeota archaeon]
MEKKGKCVCPVCPSYADCGQLAFCFTGKSKCIKKENGCMCGGCPVQIENEFKGLYYCTRGAVKTKK